MNGCSIGTRVTRSSAQGSFEIKISDLRSGFVQFQNSPPTGSPCCQACATLRSMPSGSRAFWIIILALLFLTRIPAAAGYLSIDNVNLAFALERFDVRGHQPQPPGYPYFVAF